VKTGIESNLEQLMPRRVKVDFVDPVTVTVKRTKLRRKSVGVEAKLNGLGLAKPGAQFGQLPFGPACAFAAHRLPQYNVAREHIVRLKRRRLVLNLEHRP
jgi:hypothetical protein